jgi:hypothetical protein
VGSIYFGMLSKNSVLSEDLFAIYVIPNDEMGADQGTKSCRISFATRMKTGVKVRNQMSNVVRTKSGPPPEPNAILASWELHPGERADPRGFTENGGARWTLRGLVFLGQVRSYVLYEEVMDRMANIRRYPNGYHLPTSVTIDNWGNEQYVVDVINVCHQSFCFR